MLPSHHSTGSEKERFVRLVEGATSSQFRAGNSFEVLQNGDEIFPSMLSAIQNAEHSIEFLSYVFWRSDIASAFTDALIKKAKAGVKVRLCVDAFGGASMSSRAIWQLERVGVKIGWFRPGGWQNLRLLNNRTHRKILIVDGRIGFTGGVGIADYWTGHAQDLKHWRETHCRIAGPAVADLHAAFIDNWPGELDSIEESEPCGSVAVQTTVSTAGRRPTNAEALFSAVLAGANHSLLITSAYFVPSKSIENLLISAVSRGVEVTILTNGANTNHRITMLAGRSSYRRLLEGGVKLFEYSKTLHHGKIVIVDDCWATLGSINLDTRSLVLNDEINVSIVDHAVVQTLKTAFEEDLAHSKELHFLNWVRRSRAEQLAELGSSIFKNQL
jgi:cardiolipin synthase A/B